MGDLDVLGYSRSRVCVAAFDLLIIPRTLWLTCCTFRLKEHHPMSNPAQFSRLRVPVGAGLEERT